jgi:hypothetical protein
MNLDDDDFDTVDELPAGPRRTIPEADLELLRLAARALGASEFEEIDGEDYVNLHFAASPSMLNWNPLRFTDNALDLAVRLPGLNLRGILAEAWQSHDDHDRRLAYVQRGIVGAAAEIGKAI